MSAPTFVIVGGGLAAGKAAAHLREQGFDGRLLVICAEPERPYERPPLSKDYLRGESERDKAHVHDESFYPEHEIELMTSATVGAIDPAGGRLTLEGGQELAFDRLLLTTGAEPRRLAVPGSELSGIYYLRTLADCEALRERLDAGARVAVVGAGWIGSEVAASARQRGLEVTMIDPLQLPNERIFGAEIGRFYRDVHAEHGVELMLDDGVESFEGDNSVQRVRTTSGKTVECDFAVIGVGVAPRVELAREAGLEIDNGIAVNEHVQALIRSQQAIDVGRLPDADTSLDSLADQLTARSWLVVPNPNLQSLHDAGVSIWLDTLSRQLLEGGEFAELIRESSAT